MTRCAWSTDNEKMIAYHDHEWGNPVHDDQLLFEFLILEGMQAGLSWTTILNKRENFRRAFDNFDIRKVSNYKKAKIDALLQDAGIIRNKLKVNGAVKNAQAFIEIQSEFGSFDTYIWQFTGGKTKHNKFKLMAEIPASTDESLLMSKDLKKRGFTFIGTTICYAFMQACGMVNDHTIDCFRYKQLS